MSDFEKLKSDAFKEERESQEEKGKELAEKVKGVSDAKKKLVKDDSSARSVLENFKGAKDQMKSLKGEFERILEDSTVRTYLKKRGIETLEDYTRAKDGEEDGLAKKHTEAKEALTALREKLRTEVRVRAQAKDELLDELQENDPKVKNRTFKGLTQEANSQVENISKEEISKLISELLVGRKEVIRDFLVQFFEKKQTQTLPTIVSKEIIIRFSEFGPGYFFEVKREFLAGMDELVHEAVNEWWDHLDSAAKVEISNNLMDKTRGPVETIRKIITDRIIYNNFREAEREVENLDQKLNKEKELEKLKKMTKETEQAFTELDVIVRNSPSRLVVSFKRNADDFVVNFEVLDKEDLMAKYFSKTLSGETYWFSGMDWLPEKIEMVQADLTEAKDKRDEAQKRKRGFDNKFFLAKMFAGEERRRVNRGVSKSRDEVMMLEQAETLLTGLYEFMRKMSEMEKNNGVSVSFFKETQSLTDLKETYLRALKERIQPSGRR